MRHDDILGTIGRTPVVRLRHLGPAEVNLYVKLEAFNPMGSVKDRLALGVIEDAERSGQLRPGQTVVEATSGNTGIGLAMVCAQKRYPLVVTMAENFSVERRKLLRFLGAKVILTPASEKGSGMVAKARELAEKHGWFLCHQFENEANADMHTRTTAEEILADFGPDGLDYWVTGIGTGGTLKGVARVLKVRSPRTRVVVCEPDNSQLLAGNFEQRYLDDGLSGLQRPVALGGFDHAEREPVLDGAERVERFELHVQLDTLGRDVVDAHDRRVADGVEDRIPDSGHRVPSDRCATEPFRWIRGIIDRRRNVAAGQGSRQNPLAANFEAQACLHENGVVRCRACSSP